MAEKPLKHPDGSFEISAKSFEQLKSRGDKVTWTIGKVGPTIIYKTEIENGQKSTRQNLPAMGL